MPTLWIIDGYNFIRQSSRFSELEAENTERGKAAALRWLGRFAERTGERLCVIFDAYTGIHREPIEQSTFGIQVLASRGGYTADEEIIALAREKGDAAVVVSSDREILDAAIKAGASVLKSQEFEREVGKILERGEAEDEEIRARRRPGKGSAFRPPREKKKAYIILRKYQ
jgi:uncharacterized protein